MKKKIKFQVGDRVTLGKWNKKAPIYDKKPGVWVVKAQNGSNYNLAKENFAAHYDTMTFDVQWLTPCRSKKTTPKTTPKPRTDKQRLDGLQKLLGTYTGMVVCRWSTSKRGWRLHEHSGPDAVASVREAIDSFLTTNQVVN